MPMLPTSWGDVFDRLVILRLKQAHIIDSMQRANVARELDAVSHAIGDISRFPAALHALLSELAVVNQALWNIEESKRECERHQRFDDDFVALSRSIYLHNDLRARLKKQISLLLGSALIEEKSY
ncbi:hypothetical protein FXN63_14620 [Pigmentiphaga aceris]|uniref:Uncharacterized protein n=2 Tax=Pigmentiphaga aceris TaxID=1940612 RepID=A0A5C0B8W5_9BURK|nr:hypothetical protein FXN63_14620 [Pigmentiphaga aceris]